MTDLLAGQIIAVLFLLVGMLCLLTIQGGAKNDPDVGLDIVDCGMVETPAPAPYTSPSDHPRPDARTGNAVDECNVAAQGQADAARGAWDGLYANYGTGVVHRHCLTARRDGRAACADCARVMVGAS